MKREMEMEMEGAMKWWSDIGIWGECWGVKWRNMMEWWNDDDDDDDNDSDDDDGNDDDNYSS